jgi:hypothetical protein
MEAVAVGRGGLQQLGIDQHLKGVGDGILRLPDQGGSGRQADGRPLPQA